MATEESLTVISVQSAGDLSTTGQYRFGTINSSGQIAPTTSNGARVDGIIQGNPDAADLAVGLGTEGISLIELGATLTAGDDIEASGGPAANRGRAIAGTTGVLATLLESGVSGDIVNCLLK